MVFLYFFIYNVSTRFKNKKCWNSVMCSEGLCANFGRFNLFKSNQWSSNIVSPPAGETEQKLHITIQRGTK